MDNIRLLYCSITVLQNRGSTRILHSLLSGDDLMSAAEFVSYEPVKVDEQAVKQK